MDKFPEPTPILKQLLEDKDPRSKVFKKHIVPLNNALCLASLKAKHENPNTGNFKPQVVIQGKAYYYIGPLEAEEGKDSKFVALYVYDPQLQDTARINNL